MVYFSAGGWRPPGHSQWDRMWESMNCIHVANVMWALNGLHSNYHTGTCKRCCSLVTEYQIRRLYSRFVHLDKQNKGYLTCVRNHDHQFVPVIALLVSLRSLIDALVLSIQEGGLDAHTRTGSESISIKYHWCFSLDRRVCVCVCVRCRHLCVYMWYSPALSSLAVTLFLRSCCSVLTILKTAQVSCVTSSSLQGPWLAFRRCLIATTTISVPWKRRWNVRNSQHPPFPTIGRVH